VTRQKIAIVTGGSRGIGFATVKLLCQSGIKTILTCRNPHDGQMAMMELSGYARLLDFHPLEVSDNDSVTALSEYVQKKYGYLDILVNNAGVNYDTWQTARNVAISEVEYTIDVNLIGPWRMCNVFIPLLLKEGGGRIINVSSGAGKIENQDGSTPAYSLSKNGLNMLTKSLAADLENTGISVNAVDPGWVRTSMGGENAPSSPEEGADTIVWLAAEAPKDLTGGFFHNRKPVSW
jgi:NAD(P)-dependent dehydrogenase (short-subunit alcohol dehydrogenase family)